MAIILTIKPRELNGSTGLRTHFPNTIHSNLYISGNIMELRSVNFVTKEKEGRGEHKIHIYRLKKKLVAIAACRNLYEETSLVLT